METTSRVIKEYITTEGNNPFRDWFNSLKNVSTQAKIDVRLARVRLGNFGDTESVGNGVYELKFHCKSNAVVFYFS